MLSNFARILTCVLLGFAPAAAMADEPGLSPPTITDAVRGPLRAAILRDFKQDLHSQEPRARASAGRIERCSLVIDYVQPMPAGKDTSWGVVCILASGSRERRVMACDDRYVGKFTMRNVAHASRRELIDFVAENCPPGG